MANSILGQEILDNNSTPVNPIIQQIISSTPSTEPLIPVGQVGNIGESRFDQYLGVSDLEDVEDFRAIAQPKAEKFAKGLGRVANKVVMETAKIPGYVGGIFLAMDEDNIGGMVDNAWINAINNAEQFVNEEAFKVYVPRSVQEGNLWDNISSASFWATEGADGIGFLLSMMIPGQLAKFAKIGTGIAKILGKASWANKLDDATAVLLNTTLEASAEAGETFREVEELTGNRELAGQAASDVFKTNFAILLGPNILQQKWLFGTNTKVAANKGLNRLINQETGELLDAAAPRTWKTNTAELLKKAAAGVGSEGVWEEGMQFSASEYWKDVALGETDTGWALGIAETYLESLSNTDFQKSVFLGSVLGSTMSVIGGAREQRAEDRALFGQKEILDEDITNVQRFLGKRPRPERPGLSNLLQNNLLERHQTVFDLVEYTTDPNTGKRTPVLNEDGSLKYNEQKVQEFGIDKIAATASRKYQEYANALDNKEAYDYAKNINDLNDMMPFLRQEGGIEILKKHINDLAAKDLKYQQDNLGIDASTTVEEIKQDLLAKADKFQEMYERVEADNNIYTKAKFDSKDRDLYSTWKNGMLHAKMSLEAQVDFSNNRIEELDNSITSRMSDKSGIKDKAVTRMSQFRKGEIMRINGEEYLIYKKAGDKALGYNRTGKQKIFSISDITNNDITKVGTNLSYGQRANLFSDMEKLRNHTQTVDELDRILSKFYDAKQLQKDFNQYVDNSNNVTKVKQDIIDNKVNNADTVEDINTVSEEARKAGVTVDVEEKLNNLQRIANEAKNSISPEELAFLEDLKIEAKKQPTELLLDEVDMLKTKESDGTITKAERKALTYIQDEINSRTLRPRTVTAKPTATESNNVLTEEQGAPDTLFGNLQSSSATREKLDPIEEPIIHDQEVKDEIKEYKKDIQDVPKDGNKTVTRSGAKTNKVSVAYLANQYEVKGDKLITKKNPDGSIAQVEGNDRRASVPEFMNEGTEIVLYIDTELEGDFGYDNNKEVSTIPIAIQTKEDYEAGRRPTMYLHRMDWINTDNVAEDVLDYIRQETLAIRNLFTNNTNAVFQSSVVSKSSGWTNYTNKDRSLSEIFEGNYDAIEVTVAEDAETLKGIERDYIRAKINGENKSFLPGLGYGLLTVANGQEVAIPIDQAPISNNEEMYLQNISTVANILHQFSLNNENRMSATKDMTDKKFIEEIRKYFYATNYGKSQFALLSAEMPKNLLFNVHREDDGLHVEIQGPIEGYYKKYILWDDGRISTKKKARDIASIVISLDEFAQDLADALIDKYGNIVKPEDVTNFTYLNLIEGELVQERGHYYDFLSNHSIVTMNIEGIDVKYNGTTVRTYASQPTIEIGTAASMIPYGEEYTEISDVNNVTTYEALEENDVVEEQALDVESKVEDGIVRNDEMVDEDPVELDFGDDSDLISPEDLNRSSLQSLRKIKSKELEDQIIHSMTVKLLHLTDDFYSDMRNKGKTVSIKKLVNSLKQDLVDKKNLFEKYSEVAPKEGSSDSFIVYSDPKRNAIVVKNISNILNNWDKKVNPDNNNIEFIGFSKKIEEAFNSLKFNVIQENIEDGFNEREVFLEDANYRTDPEKSMSAKVRRILAYLPIRDAEGKIKVNALKMPMYHDYINTFNNVVSILSDTRMSEMETELLNYAEYNPAVAELVKSLNNLKVNDTMTYNMFYSTMKKQQAKFLKVLYTPGRGKKGPSVKIIPSNTNGAIDLLFSRNQDKFTERAKSLGLLKEKNGELIIDTEIGQRFLEDYRKALDSSNFKLKLQQLNAVLNKLGIDISIEALTLMNKDRQYAADKGKNTYFTKNFGKKYVDFNAFSEDTIGRIFKALAGKGRAESVTEGWQSNNPFYTQSNTLKNLLRYETKLRSDIFSSSFRNAENNVIYSYVAPHYLNDRILELTQNKALRSNLLIDPFVSTSTWLNQMEDTDFNKVFELFYIDAVKSTKSYAQANAFEAMNDFEKEITMVHMFQNNGAKHGQFIYLTPSDKTTFPIIQALKHKLDIGRFSNGTINLDNNSESMKTLITILTGEVGRINAVVREFNKAKANKDFSNLIPGYHFIKVNGVEKLGAGAYFHLFPTMNDIVQRNSDSTVYYTDHGYQVLVDELNNHVTNLITEKVNEWEQLGIIENFSSTYLTQISQELIKDANHSQNQINIAAADFVTNYMIAYANMFQLFTGDPALFGKQGKGWTGEFNDWRNIVDNTASNIFKRTAKDIAPGMQGKFADDSYTVAFINEPSATSSLTEYANKLSKLASYSGLDIADAQEWTTLKEHVEVLYAYGRISKEDYDRLISLSTQIEDPEFNLDDFTLSDLKLILQPLKPVQVEAKFNATTQTDEHYYIKTSSFPLIPQLIRGTELEKVSNWMRDNGVDRLVPKSAVKVGFKHPVTLFDNNGNFIDAGKPSTVVLNRTSFRIQQDVPFDPMKNKILEGSQYRKLKFADLQHDWVFELFGKPMKASELKELDDKLHIELYKKRFADLLQKLGAEQRKNGTYDIKDFNKLRVLLVEEAQSRGYSQNDILMLNSIKFNDKILFDIPLFFHPNVMKLESLLNAIINNKVLKNKFQGKSYVQGSALGFQYDVVSEDMFNLVNNSKITYTKHYNKTGKQLDYKIETDNSGNPTSVYAEVLMPFYFKDSNGNPRNLNNYTDENGFLIEDKVDDELLNLIGYRIPTQGHNSIIKLKVVGFLPQEAGDLIIVPAAITKQMGSDFDVDKLYTHSFHYFSTNKGQLQKVTVDPTTNEDWNTEELENSILDITFSIYNHPEVMKMQLQPLDHTPLKKVKDDINNNKPEVTGFNTNKASSSSMLYNSFHKKLVNINADGKIGIGALSLASTFHALFQYSNIYLVPKYNSKGELTEEITVRFSEGGVEFVDRFDDKNPNNVNGYTGYERDITPNTGAWRLDKITGFSGKSILEVVSYIQSAAVDNAKEQDLYDLNLNKLTFDVAGLIARTGFDERFIGYFLTQPILIQYVDKVINNTNILESEYDPNKELTILTELYEELGFNYDKDVNGVFSVKPIALEDLVESIKSDTPNRHLQAQVLFNFLEYKKVARNLSKIQSYHNVDTKYLGKSVYETVKTQLDWQQSEFNTIANIENLSLNTIAGGALEYGLQASINLFNKRDLLVYNSPLFIQTIEDILFNNSNDTVSEKQSKEIIDDFKSALYSNIASELLERELNITDLSQYTYNLMYGDNTLASRVQKAKGSNFFINTLTTRLAYFAEDPSVVEGVSSGDISTNLAIDMSIGWNELLNSDKSSEEFKLGFDLLIYSLAIGNDRNARDFGRYMPYDYLSSSNYGEIARSINFGYDVMDTISSNMSNNFVQQYFQHHPFRTIQVENTDLVYAVDENGKSTKDNIFRFKIKDISVKSSNKKFFVEADGGLYPRNYVSKTNSEGTVSLYKYNTETDDYQKIPTLGNKQYLIKEFNITEENHASKLDGVYSKNKKMLESAVLRSSEVKQSTKKSVNTITGGKASMDRYGFNSKNYKKVLHNIMHGGTYSNLAKHYYENLLDIIGNDLKIDYYDINNPEHGAPTDPIGRYRPSKHLLLINPKHIKSDIDFEYAFLHELNHAVFSRAINRKESLSVKAQEAITNLENLVNTLNSDKTFLSLLKETYPDIIGEQGYPVKDVKEFLSYLMNDSTFQQLLNDYKYEGKSLLIKILEYLSNIVGIDINKNSALYEAMKQVTLLIQDIKPTTKSAEQGLKNLASMSKSKVETMQDKINRLATLKVSKPDSDLINNYSEFSKTLPVEQRRILAAKIREGLLIIKCN